MQILCGLQVVFFLFNCQTPVPEGKYRFCKEVTDYRGAGDYDTYVYKAEFEIGI